MSFALWITHGRTEIFRSADAKAYAYTANGLSIDADGAPNAYHPGDTGLDALRNANYPDHDWKDILLPDPKDPGNAYVQPAGPFKGYYLSMTALTAGLASTDPANYVDASRIPYIVFPRDFQRALGTGDLGDFVAAYSVATGQSVCGVVADIGGAGDPLNEVSICLAETLSGQKVNPRNAAGAPTGDIVFLVFPHSHNQPRWPVPVADINSKVSALVDNLGGWPKIVADLRQA